MFLLNSCSLMILCCCRHCGFRLAPARCFSAVVTAAQLRRLCALGLNALLSGSLSFVFCCQPAPVCPHRERACAADLLTSVPVWSLTLAAAANSFSFYMLLSCLPTFLVRRYAITVTLQRRLSQYHCQALLPRVSLVHSPFSLVGGLNLTRKPHDSTRALGVRGVVVVRCGPHTGTPHELLKTK
jgi:hypothetical protein